MVLVQKELQNAYIGEYLPPFNFVGSTQGEAKVTYINDTDTPVFYSFTDNGNRILVILNNLTIKEYSLSTAYDLTSTTLINSKNITLDHDVRGGFIGNGGKEIYLIGLNNSERVSYFSKIHSTDGTISGITGTVTKSTSLASYNYPASLCYSEDGTKLYLGGTTTIHEFLQSTPRGVDLSNYVGYKSSAVSNSALQIAMRIDKTGTKIYGFSNTGQRIFQGTLSTPRDITTYTKDYEEYAGYSGYINGGFDFNNKNECILIGGYYSNRWWTITSGV